MNTTPKLPLLGFAAMLAWQSQWAAAESMTEIARHQLTLFTVAQVPGRPTVDPRRQTISMLEQARAAMRQGDWQQAEQMVSAAESTGFQFGPFHVGDTPAKVRKDLAKLQAQPPQSGAQGRLAAAPMRRPGRSNAPLSMRTPGKAGVAKAGAIPADPFASQEGTALATDSGVSEDPVDRLTNPKGQASAYVANARKEIARGDLKAAVHWYKKARDLNAEFGEGEYGPEQLRAEILRQNAKANQALAVDEKSTPRREELPPEAQDAVDRLLGSKELVKSEIKHLERAAQSLPDAADELNLDQMLAQGEAGAEEHKALVVKARQALAAQKPSAAEMLLKQAEALPGSDAQSVQDLRKMIGEYQSLARQAKNGGATPEFKASYAAFLNAQAEGLSEVDSAAAESLRTKAAKLMAPAPSAVSEVKPASADSSGDDVRFPVSRSVYDPATDKTRTQKAAAQIETAQDGEAVATDLGEDSLFDAPQDGAEAATESRGMDALENGGEQSLGVATSKPSNPNSVTGMSLFQKGQEALQNGETAQALNFFNQANERATELDAQSRDELRQHLRLLVETSAPARREVQNPGAPVDPGMTQQQKLYQQVSSDLARQQVEARRIRETEPAESYSVLKKAREQVAKSGLEGDLREQLLRRVDISLEETEQYIEANKSQIELDQKNKSILDEIAQRKQLKVEIDSKIAKIVDDFNRLLDEHRFAEAHQLAKKAEELDPNNRIVVQLLHVSKYMQRVANNSSLRDRKENGVLMALDSVEESGIPFDDREPLQMMNVTDWAKLTKSREQYIREQGRQRNDREKKIQQSLSKMVSVDMEGISLEDAIKRLSDLTGVPMWLDPLALQGEGVNASDKVNLKLTQEVQLKSALALLLDPLELSYVIKDDVLKITNREARDGDLYMQTYNVADIVIPIPNFTGDGTNSLNSLIRQGLADAGMPWGGGGPGSGGFGMGGGVALASASSPVSRNSNALAQVAPETMPGTTPNAAIPGGGPGGVRGGALADFDTLIDLIVTTIAPDSWDEVGGRGSIREFPSNLSMVVSQTEEVHEQIKDLLDQLRRLQDLQVTIEVRFITLQDDFFERIGLDFDFDINDNVAQRIIGTKVDGARGAPVDAETNGDFEKPAVTLGLSGGSSGNGFGPTGTPNFTSDFDLQFRQGSFGATAPLFGGFDPATAATFGFAILSDIEAYFFVQAAQGDQRTNVLQAPKVTLFNGQFASINDTSNSPFVTSVIPVVGDFAAAQQPVIVVLPEGTQLGVQAVVSPDKQHVRMTLLPQFSQITDVNEFTFEGTTTTVDNSSQATDEDAGTKEDRRDRTNTTTGTTVQLPTLASVSVTTTVSVPDGGTILLGGIKRLREGRNERGVPILAKLPYINRLFKNASIGRETQSLMLMVTPRIIIQEEEEEKLLGSALTGG